MPPLGTRNAPGRLLFAAWSLLIAASSAADESATWPAEPKAVLGIVLGAPLRNSGLSECTRAELYSRDTRPCYEDRDLRMAANSGAFQVHGLPSLTVGYEAFVDMHDAQVVAVELSTRRDSFETMLDLLKARYGEPSSSTTADATYRNGTKIAVRTVTWAGATVQLRAREGSPTIDKATYSFIHLPTLKAMAAARNRQKASDAAKF